MIVSLTTPHGSGQTEQSSLATRSSESIVTEPDLARDLGRLVDDIRRYDDARGGENRDIGDNLRALRDELRNLSDFLHQPRLPAEPPARPLAPERPQVQYSDRRVGGSSAVTSPLPDDRGSPSGLTRATSLASSIGSFLSSPHTEESLMLSSEPSSPFLEPSDFTYESESSPISSVSSSFPPLPPSSPTPSSSTSSITVRQPQVPDLLDLLNAIRDQVGALQDGQTSTSNALDQLLRRPPPPDNSELLNRLQRIEGILQALAVQPRAVSPTESEDSLSRIQQLLTSFPTDLPAPAPARAPGPSLVQQLDDILYAGTRAPPVIIEQPPPIVPFVYQPRERISRTSISPVSISSLPLRPESEPPMPQIFYRPVRYRPSRRYPPREASPTAPPVEQGVPGEEDIDMEREIRDRRRRRRPGTDGIFVPGFPGPVIVRDYFFMPFLF